MLKKKNIILITIFFALTGIAVGMVLKKPVATHLSHKEIYYCPMHPNYTSDRPGVCPICNMQLVKRDVDPSNHRGKKEQNICFLHKCPMKHDGNPCPMLMMAEKGENVTCPFCKKQVSEQSSQSNEKKILYWTDPMIPGYKSDKPGKSPMGMELIPVYDEMSAPASADHTASSSEGYTPIWVTPQKQQLIGIKTDVVRRKRLTKMIRTVGTVAHDPELYQAQTEHIQAARSLEQARQGGGAKIIDQVQRLVDASRIRLRHMGLSDELILEISQQHEADHNLLFSNPGQPVWVYAQIYEYELPLVRAGQTVTVTIPNSSQQQLKGTIRAIDLLVDPMTRTTKIRAQIDDPQGQLRPDMYLNIIIAIDLGELLAVAQEAVFDTGIRKIVFVDKGEGLFEPHDVQVGVKTDDEYEIQSGVREGDRVVTSGNFLIDSESRLKAALENMGSSSESGGHIHGQ